MLSIKPNENTERENYKLLIGTVTPRPIAFVTSMSEKGILNGAPFSYFNIVTADPPMLSISVQRNKGIQKDTARNIKEQKNFVVHITDEENVEKVNQTAGSYKADESEVEAANLTPVPSDEIGTPGIQEAKVRFECELEQHIEIGKEGAITTDLILGKIVRIHVDPSIYNDGKIIYKNLRAVSRLAGNDYAKIGEIFSIKRPE